MEVHLHLGLTSVLLQPRANVSFLNLYIQLCKTPFPPKTLKNPTPSFCVSSECPRLPSISSDAL